MKQLISNIRTFLIFVFTVMLNMAYESHFANSPTYNAILTSLFGILFILSIDLESIIKYTILRNSLSIIILVFLFSLILSVGFDNELMTKDVRSIGMCIVAMLVGWKSQLSEKRIVLLVLIFCLCNIYVGMEQVNNNIGGFIIEDAYLAESKNSLGVLLSTGVVGMLFLVIFRNKHIPESIMAKRKVASIGAIFISIISIIILLTIRARADSLAAFVMIIYMLILRFSKKNWYKTAFIITAIIIAGAYLLPDVVTDYVYNSFFQHYEDRDITAGRTERNIFVIEFLKNHFFAGNLIDCIEVPIVHNFILYKLFCYGAIFSIPILVLYFSLLYKSIKLSLTIRDIKVHHLGIFLILVPFIVSLFEYSFPFGPGTATLFNFIIFGYSLNRLYQCNE